MKILLLNAEDELSHESFFEVGNRFKTKLAVIQSRVEKGRFVVNGRVFVARSDSEKNLAA